MQNVNYNDLRIYELRDFARSIGVRQSTTKTKSELIEAIKDIESGKVKPFKTIHGRKPINSVLIESNTKLKLHNEIEKLRKKVNAALDGLLNKIN